jgi:hypothetical protein
MAETDIATPPWTEIVASVDGGKLVYIPDELFKVPRRHRKDDKWVRLWFYKDRHKKSLQARKIKNDFDITSKLEYQNGTFYKISQLSDDDSYFDYFYKLKSGLPKDIFKKNNRFKTPLANARCRKTRERWKEPGERVYNVNEKGNHVVKFE